MRLVSVQVAGSITLTLASWELSTKTGGAACAANDNKVDTEKSKKVSNERTSDLGKGEKL
jgi:hypothetical protein